MLCSLPPLYEMCCGISTREEVTSSSHCCLKMRKITSFRLNISTLAPFSNDCRSGLLMMFHVATMLQSLLAGAAACPTLDPLPSRCMPAAGSLHPPHVQRSGKHSLAWPNEYPDHERVSDTRRIRGRPRPAGLPDRPPLLPSLACFSFVPLSSSLLP